MPAPKTQEESTLFEFVADRAGGESFLQLKRHDARAGPVIRDKHGAARLPQRATQPGGILANPGHPGGRDRAQRNGECAHQV